MNPIISIDTISIDPLIHDRLCPAMSRTMPGMNLLVCSCSSLDVSAVTSGGGDGRGSARPSSPQPDGSQSLLAIPAALRVCRASPGIPLQLHPPPQLSSCQEGLDILSHGAPIGNDFQTNDSVLNYDIDREQKNESTAANAMSTLDTCMDSDNNEQHIVLQHLDAVYLQCCSASTAKQTQDLVSVSRDSTFGQRKHPQPQAVVLWRITLASI
jgi:hypothetical protein